MNEDGFTLLEVLLALVISSIVFGVVSAAFIIGLRSTGESTDRLLESQDGAFSSAFFLKDVQGATTVRRTGSCASASGTQIASFSRQETLVSGTSSTTADYRYDGATGQLVRYTCGTAGAESRVLATRLSAAPELRCPSAADDCSAVRRLTLTLTDRIDGRFSITATRRLP